jgi:hypothetical protein
MNLKQKFAKILNALGFTQKAKDSSLSVDEWKAIQEAYKKEFGTELASDLEAEKANSEQLKMIQELASILNTSDEEGTATDGTSTEAPPAEQKEATGEENKPEAVLASAQKLVAELKTLKQENAKMSKQASPDITATTVGVVINAAGPGTTKEHLFGIQHEMFSMDKRHNQIAVNPAIATLSQADEQVHGKAFRKELSAFTRSLQQRFNELKSHNMLNPELLVKSDFTLTTTGLSGAGLGSQYMIRRQDALIARILSLRNVNDLFPTRSGIQDRELITNAFFSEVSQGYQTGAIYKGGMTLSPEYGYVDDAMMKTKFGPMKEIERLYIGYLNTDGSDPIKWSMIEFCLLGMYQEMQKEQNKRHIMGIFCKPETGVAGSYLNAATGVIYTLIRYIHEFKLLPLESTSYNTYTSSTFLTAVKAFVADIKLKLDDDQDLSDKAIYLNANHKDWWLANCRTTYGKDMDFTGPTGYLNVMPDSDLAIKWVPNMGQLKMMFTQTPGNIQFLEFVPGEMLSVNMSEDMEEVKAWSTWKEGCGIAFVGKPFATLAAQVTNNYSMQQVFVNKPFAALAADATTCDANNGFWFKTGVNTAEKTISTISNAKKGPAYIIECGDITNVSKIAKSGDFSKVEAWTPTAEGDYIMVGLDSNSKFFEYERMEGGTRTIVAAVQPNVPGAR